MTRDDRELLDEFVDGYGFAGVVEALHAVVVDEISDSDGTPALVRHREQLEEFAQDLQRAGETAREYGL